MAIEEVFQRTPDQALAVAPEQVDGALVGRLDTPVAIEGDQPFAEQPNRLRLQVEAQQPLVLEAAQEVAAFDGLGRQVDQRHGVELALPGHLAACRGNVEHRQKVAVRIEHRAGGTGEAGVAAAEVFVLVNGQRLALDQAGADAVGALVLLAPVGAEPEAGLLEGATVGIVVDAVEDYPARIGEQHRIAGAGELLVQAGHFAVGDFQHLLQTFAAFEHACVFEHSRRLRLRRVEAVLLQAAQPGAGDGGIGRRSAGLELAAGHGHDLTGVATQVVRAHCSCSPQSGRIFQASSDSVSAASSESGCIAMFGRPSGHDCHENGTKCHPGLSQPRHSALSGVSAGSPEARRHKASAGMAHPLH
ncbi:hypothetical protein D3C76_932390 [compost metagenome]